ncbi:MULTISPECIES: hemerythrin domain-containing protein [unclassified Streptomyces]|uniref:hemerythrin domain-containing protein n=1 Tax=unclassified Streptomyces TaxID=2593676 RepID=UPI00341F1BA9
MAKHQADEPADTRMMGIIHDALRRDLARTRTALTEQPYPDGNRRVALADHLRWMMRFLHDHHSSEDRGLWPLLRKKAPDAAELLDTMEQDHAGISDAMTAVVSAAHRYAEGGSDETRVDLLASLTALEDALLPHLQREEQQTMPVAASTLTVGEWRTWEQEFHIKQRSFTELGDEGHWLLDGLDSTRYQIVVRQVPTVPRFILLHGFARRYQRRAALRWQPNSPH